MISKTNPKITQIKEFRSNGGSGHAVVLGGGLWQDKEVWAVQCGLWDPLKGFKKKDFIGL